MGTARIPESRKYWYDLALFYCSKRETSRARLRSYLVRKIREYRITPEEAPRHLEWCESVLDEFQEKRIIDHSRYAGILHRDYQRRGKGKRYIEQKMKERGLETEAKELEFDAAEELDRATQLAEKTLSRASIAKIEDPYQRRTRILQKLVSSGFDLDVSKKAIELALRPK